MITKPSSQGASTKPAPAKRSLFNKPSWSKPQTASTSNLFHRSDRSYVTLPTEAEQEKKHKVDFKEPSPTPQEPSEARSPKRRRVSDIADDDLSTSGTESHTPTEPTIPDLLKSRANDAIAAITSMKPKAFLASTYEAKFHPQYLEEDEQKAQGPDVIDLDDGDVVSKSPSTHSTANFDLIEVPRPIEEDEFKDEEFPELARKAREKAQKKRREQDSVSSTPEATTLTNRNKYSQPQPTPPAQSPPPDPVLQILITSDILNTKPLIVTRKLSQHLRDVRLAWTGLQGLTREFSETVFLVWRGRRLFDVTTCKSLGFTVDANGRASSKADILGDEGGKVHMEAMTSEILEAYKQSKRRRHAGQEDEQAGVEEAPPVAEEKQEAQIRVILKAKGYSDFKLIVKPTTSVSKILKTFRNNNGIPADKEVFLIFDGDRISPDSKVGDTEISDLDEIDVYIK